MLERLFQNRIRIQTIFLLIADALVIQVSSFMGLWFRFDMQLSKIPEIYVESAIHYAGFYTFLTVFLFYLFRLYSFVWNVAGIREELHIVASCMLSSLFQILGMWMLSLPVPKSYYALCFATLTLCVTLVRLWYRARDSLRLKCGRTTGKRIMIVGAGVSGTIILKEILTSKNTEGNVICFVDDDKNKQGKYLNGILIAGGRVDIPILVKQYRIQDIYLAMPSAPSTETKKILEICYETDCRLKILPGIYQLLNGEVCISGLREIHIEDLLGREPIRANLYEIMESVENRVVFVTGGGGAIGSELCRQIARCNPKQLIIFDVYENNVYDLQQELKWTYPEINFKVLIGSVRNTHRIESVFETYRPDLVYHAAAYKNISLLEASPNEAIKNNVFGTYKMAAAADKYEVEKFILVSEDKSVNPSNIMEASQFICEMVIQMINRHSKTRFAAVRFGNILENRGSVIPQFKKQIEEGGPITVAAPDTACCFMTIPEAVSLILQAGVYIQEGETFILNMGEPVRILDLAENLIRLSGYVPNKDIMIKFTGNDKGDKPYEKLLADRNELQNTLNKCIYIRKQIPLDEEIFKRQLGELYEASSIDSNQIKEIVHKIVPTYGCFNN